MKHVFYIHSHITFYVAKSIQEYLGLTEENILYITDRNYRNKYHSFSPYVIDKYDTIRLIPRSRFWRLWKYIPLIDKELEAFLNNEDFVFYLPIFGNFPVQIIATHKHCRQIHFLEEGSTSYANYNKFLQHIVTHPLREMVKYLLNSFGIIGKRRFFFFHDFRSFALPYFGKYKNVTGFTLHKRGFSHAKALMKKVIPLVKMHTKYSLPQKSAIFIFDGTGSRSPALMHAVITIVETHRHTLPDYVYLKFHPRQSKEERNGIIETLRSGEISTTVIPDNEPLEPVLLNVPNLRLYGFHSSLLLYAILFNRGHKVISFEKHLLQYYTPDHIAQALYDVLQEMCGDDITFVSLLRKTQDNL